MAQRILFHPHEYRDLSPTEQDLLAEGYQKAIEALERNITPHGFSACSLADNTVYGTDANYRSVWARDGAMTIVWTLDLDQPHIRALPGGDAADADGTSDARRTDSRECTDRDRRARLFGCR